MATQLAEAPEAPEEPQTGNDNAEARPDRDYEAEARAQGWRPKEEFKGAAEQWSDAETFVKRADEVLPLIKKQNAHLKQEIDLLKRMVKKVQASEQKAYANALADLEARQEAAVETGDIAEHRRLKDEIEKVREEIVGDTATDVHGEDPREQYDAFRESNSWYDKANLASASEVEIEARLYADRLAEQWVRAGKDKETPPSEFFAGIAEAVEAKFPTLKNKAVRPKPASDVAGITRPGAGKGKTGAHLPSEAKETVRRYMRQGIYKGTFEEACNAFAKDYFTAE